jgi:hypothetical protein
MAQTYNFDGVKLIVPGSYVKTTVLNGNAGLATTGIVALVGEADSGPSYDLLKKSKVNGGTVLVDGDGNRVCFTPDELSLVQGMFGGGRLVDAFAALAAPFSGINAVAGAPSLVYVIKTNAGTKASVDLEDDAPTAIATIESLYSGTNPNGTVVKVEEASTPNAYGFNTLTFKVGPQEDEYVVNDKAALHLSITGGYSYGFTITSTTLSIDSESFVLKNYKTVQELADAISKIAGLTAAPTEEFKWQSPVALFDYDSGVTLDSSNDYWVGVLGSQLKAIDSSFVNFVPTYARPSTIADATLTLSGGTLGSTDNDDVQAALAKLEPVNVNFVVPLFSQDASADITAGETDASSAYTISGVTIRVLTHVTNMSKIKIKKNRQAFLSHKGTYAATKALVNGSAFLSTPYQFRGSLAFQPIKMLNSVTNATETFQPWMVSAIAAAAQSAAGYRPIFNKGLNILGVEEVSGYDGGVPAQEDALQSGLLVLADSSNGVDTVLLSDQTTYLFPDNNFVYNSIQAVYGADVIALTLQQQTETFVGQSTADVSAPVAASFIQSVLANLLNQKWIAPSADAPAGYKNLKVSINAPVMNVSVECKESTGIYFVPINLSISGVQSAV